MKTLKYSIYTLACTLFVSCMGASYADPEIEEIPFGNNELAETNVVTIAQLKSDYATLIENSNMKEITEDIQIKGIVTGNDAGGNLYRMIPVDDGTGAINVGIDMNGLCRELKVGQEVLISLKGLMIGGNSQQPQVGGIYTNTTPSSANYGKQSVGSMNRYVWETHHKLIGLPDPTRVEPEEFDIKKVTDAAYMKENCGKLMTIKGVTFRDADGTAVFAPEDLKDAANGVDRALKEVNSRNLVVRGSTFARFANAVMPTEAVDITGIFNRYRDKWQILVRDINDIQSAKKFSVDDLEGSGKGTEESPFNVTRAMALALSGYNDTSVEVYITGIISSIKEVSTSYGNATYFISDDGKTDTQLQVFRGYYIDGDKFTDETKDALQVGQKVVILGKLTLYNGEPEVNSGNKIISIK